MSDNPQARIWNETVGVAWATNAQHYDAMLEPFGAAVISLLDVQPDERVVDVGCGTGATTVELARRAAMVLGVDLSWPMLATARDRAAAAGADNVVFSAVDVQAEPFATGEYDVAFSRFGVMFFADPIRAFTHVRLSLIDGGRLGFVCFQRPLDNPFILVPVMAAAPHLSMPPPPPPTDPGPFSLADVDRTRSILIAAGFVDVTIEAGPTSVELGAADDLPAVARRVLEQNPGTAPALLAASAADRRAAIDATIAALADHVAEGSIALAAASWIVSARAG